MSDNVKVISSNTIVKKITVGTPVPVVAAIEVVSDVADLRNVNDVTAVPGQLLIYDEAIKKYVSGITLDKQIIEGGDGFS
jgi:hypothetical protein